MRLALINCILLALFAAALAEEVRPRRHLHQIKQLIANKLFGSGESNCTQPTEARPPPPPLGTKFFRIPGFNDVVIKAVPKGSNPEPAPVYEDEELPPNSHIGIVGSYLGTTTLNETYNALLGVKNLLSSGILTAKRDVLREFTLPHLPKVQVISSVPSKLIKPCAAPDISPLPLEPVRVFVRPPKIPVVPTQYSYKQVNQDGSLTTYTSALDLENGVRVIEDGRTLPFFIDRVQKLPVRLPVPVLPEVSKIIVSEAVHPSTYSYQQIHQDGRMTSYMGLPPLISMPGPVVVKESIKRIPPPPVYLMDRIEKVASIASSPRVPLIHAMPKPAVTSNVSNAPEPGPFGYSYSQMTVNGGTTTHSASGPNAAVLVTENGLPAAPLNALPSWPEKNPFGPPRGYGFSYDQAHGGGQTTRFNGLRNQAGPVNVIEHRPSPPSMPLPPNTFSYRQIGDGKMITYTGLGIIEESHGAKPAVVIHGMNPPVPPPRPSTYSYQQIHQDSRMTSYMGLPPLVSMPGPVVVTETVKRIPPSPVYLMDRIEKVASIASFPRAPSIDAASKPAVAIHAPNAPVKGRPVPEPGPVGYSYSQMTVNGGTTTHSASGPDAAVLVTENGLPAASLNVLPSWPEKNPFGPPRGYGFSYGQVHGGGQTTSLNGLGDQAGPVNVIEHRPAPPSMPLPPNAFSYKQIGDGKMITYTGSGNIEESQGVNPGVVIYGMGHPVPPSLITDRIEKIAAGAKFNRPPYSTPFAVPIPTNFVHIPSVHASVPQRPVKIPIPSRPSPFMYKHIHSDGSVTSYGGEGIVEDGNKKLPPPADMAKPFPQGNVRIIESDTGPFPMNPVNPNAVKPSTPVSGSYAYKTVNHPPVGPIDGPVIDTFAPPPPMPSIPAPIQGCIDPDVTNSAGYIANPLVRPAVLFENPVPLTYSYKQISHSNPNPFLVVNVEDPVIDVNKVGMKFSHDSYANAYQPPPPPPVLFPSVDVIEHKPIFVQPAPFVPATIINRSVPQPSIGYSSPSSFSYKQVSSQPQPPHPAVNDMEHSGPQMNNMHSTNVQKETSPSSSFSYKQVISQALPPLPSLNQPTDNVMEHKPNAFVQPMQFVPPQTSNVHSINVPSSFSYKQVTGQENQPLFPSPQPSNNDMDQRLSAPPLPSPMIHSRGSHIQKDSGSSSFSYKQVTNQGVYEYSDEFPTGAKTNLHSNPLYPQGNPSGDVYVEQKPLPDPSIPMTVPASPMPIQSRPKPSLERRNSFSNNPIVVPEQSSFSFKSSNADGSTITVKNGGHNSVAVQLAESPKTDSSISNQEPRIPAPPTPIANEVQRTEAAFVNESTAAPLPEKETQGPVSVSGHAKPLRRRVIKRVKSVKQQRGDIPDTE